MKKIILLISLCLCPLIFSFKSSAASFAISPESLLSIEEGINDMSLSAYYSYGITPTNANTSLSALAEVAGKADIRSMVYSSDFDVITDFEDMPYDFYSVLSDWQYCDSNGNILASTDDLKYGHFDNGYFSGDVIFNQDGKIVYRYIEGDTPYEVCNISFGGRDMSRSEYKNAYQNISVDAKLNNYSYATSGSVSGSNTTYYLWVGTFQGWTPVTYHMFIANQYQPGVVMPNTAGSYISSWYANDLSVFNYDNTGNSVTISQGNYSYGGYNYRYIVTFLNKISYANATVVPYSTWVNDPHSSTCLARVGTNLDNTLINSGAKNYVPVEVGLNKRVVSVDTPVGLTQVKDYVDSLPNKYSADTTYDGTQAISDSNFPIVYPVTGSISGVIPFPDTEVIEDDEDAVIDYPFDDVISIPDGGFDIPIIDNLKNRFPFSIPWDIKNLLKSLRANPTAPKFEIAWYIAPLNYTWQFSLDLSSFNSVAELFRTLFLISFVIGLALFSYKHFFGS